MANINVAVQKTIADGYKVKFRTPCDSTTIEGLEVKYPAKNGVGTLIKSFVFKDAHGTELSGVGNLFVRGVMIEVLLDVTHGVAYIQNADTNSYIEGIKKEISTIEKNTKEMLKLAEKAVDDCEDATSNANQAAAVAREVVGGITTIEQNNNTPLQFWVGSKEEYDAIVTKEDGCFYIISDDADYQEIVNAFKALAGDIEKNAEDIQGNTTAIQNIDKALGGKLSNTHLNEPLIWVDDSTQTENKLQELFKAMPDTTFARYYFCINGSYSVFELSKASNGWGHMERLNYDSRSYRTCRGGKDDNGNITYTFEPWIQFAPVEPNVETVDMFNVGSNQGEKIGTWLIRKWNNGIVELFGNATVTGNTGLFDTATIPSMIETPHTFNISAQCDKDAAVYVSVKNLLSNRFTYILGGVGVSTDITLHIHAVGKWKTQEV